MNKLMRLGQQEITTTTGGPPQVPAHVATFLGKLFIAFPGNVPQDAMERMEVIAVYGEALAEFSAETLQAAYKRLIQPGVHKHAPFRPDLPTCIEVCRKIEDAPKREAARLAMIEAVRKASERQREINALGRNRSN